MAISKVTLNGTTLMDVTQDTVDAENLLAGETATKANGVRTTGTLDIPNEYGMPYSGVDLTVKFATEISGFSDAWAWIEDRITDGNFSGIHIGDYIPFTCTNTAQTQLNAKIIGVNTYKGYGNTEIGNHIDFWAGLWPTTKPINPVGYNNGTSASAYPWLASDAYLFANSLQGSVPTAVVANPTLEAKDYRSDGIYYYLPSALKNVIVEKRLLLGSRYNASALQADDNSWGWTDIGKIWPLYEIEVYGTVHQTKPGYATSGFVSYPFFMTNMNRIAFGRTNTWLLSAMSGNGANWTMIAAQGYAASISAATSGVALPVCFRIA